MMSDGRRTSGEIWRDKAQDFFTDINSPELIMPEVPLIEKMEMWDLYLSDIKRVARKGNDAEKKELQELFGVTHVGQEKVDSPFKDIGSDELMSDTTKEVYNMDDFELEDVVKQKIPKHAFYDLYNMFFTPNSEMKIKSAPENLRWMEKLLFNSNNPYVKAITENIPVYSYVASTEIIKALLGAGKELNDGGVGSCENQEIQNIVKEALNNAQEKMDQMESVSETCGAGKIDSELSFKDMTNISEYYSILQDVPLKDDLLRDFIKKTLKLSRSYFSSRYTEVEETILEVDQLEDLEGLENLISPLDQFNLEEVVTHERLYHTKINVYIDRSGSMAGWHSYNGKKNTFVDSDGNLEDLGMAKLTALKLNTMGEVNEVRAFDTQVYEPLDVRGMLFLETGGGTNINTVIKHIVSSGSPSLILTDMGDSISEYSPEVYFIGVGGADFRSFMNSEVGKQYIKNHQCVKYLENTHEFVKITGSNVKTVG